MPPANASISLTVKGSEIDIALMKSPLMIIVFLIIILTFIGTYYYYRNKPKGGAKIKLTGIAIIAVLIILLAIPLAAISWDKEYGLWVNNKTIYVRYYDNDVFKANICNSNITLVKIGKAINMLSIRTNGITDPTSNIRIGHYKLNDGSKGDVIILGKTTDYAIIIDNGREKAIIGLNNTKEFYNELTKLINTTCRK